MMVLLNSDAAENFIEAEVSTAELFVRLALDAREVAARERYLGVASKAYETAWHFFPRASFPTGKRHDFEKRLTAVQSKLVALGVSAA